MFSQLCKLENLKTYQLWKHVNFPQLQNLKKLNIAGFLRHLGEKKIDTKVLMKGLKKMPALERLNIHSVFADVNLNFIFEVIKMAISQKKNITVFIQIHEFCDYLITCALQDIKISRKDETLTTKNLDFSVSSRTPIGHLVVKFVRETFASSYVVEKLNWI